MTGPSFPRLFSPLKVRGLSIKNRILSTGHDTVLPIDSRVSDELVAYHAARARGGAGLIIMQVAGIHETARYTARSLMATDDDCIEGYRRVAQACHAEGCAVFAQLFHPGREVMETADGLQAVAYSSSAVPNERFRVVPRPLSRAMIRDIVAGYAAGARRVLAAGLDGVEIVASHGYLPSQFLNPSVNHREDEYGGSDENRLQFLAQVLDAVRVATSDDFVVGLRISAGEHDEDGLTEQAALAACVALQDRVDFFGLTFGTSASLGGAVHIVPPMTIPNAYLAPAGARFKAALSKPVLLAGRINQPQEAEAVLGAGQADMCGMTRALIADPEMPNKARLGRSDDIRACVACNQSCIGRFQRGFPISCIQQPETGRELRYGTVRRSPKPKRVMVIGGGPAGMKAAVVAAQRGHAVTLYEAAQALGGQVGLAQLLPGRAEFGGVTTNLLRELAHSGVRVIKGVRVDRERIARESPDALVFATGARPRTPELIGSGELQVVDCWQVLRAQVEVGSSVLVADWRSDWIGSGVATLLARNGCKVRLAVNGTHAGESLPSYVRDDIVAQLHRLGVDILCYARLYGYEGRSVYMQHIASDAPLVVEEVDTLVLSQGHLPEDRLFLESEGMAPEIHAIGDCLAPRTVEEAIYEGLQVAWRL
ncbi:FAD-dependent oxidoreductase [Variovorax sp. J22P271]|uniref:oxidoreductase n=1 Tax=Variovorax davisae TaxID=3053515 RepID=UPI002575D5FA|nr:FAD-dependent oxidoreductase [Variovorax sp. J22P271]MDM0031779.1 FAD-dependent oxidoreductase [Variovorax sp. J22P271]